MASTSSFTEEENARNLQRVFEVFAHTQEEENESGAAPTLACSEAPACSEAAYFPEVVSSSGNSRDDARALLL